MKKIIFLALSTLMFVTSSVFALSVREVLGDLLRDSPEVTRINLSWREIDDLDGLSEVAMCFPNLESLDLNHNKIAEIPPGIFLGFRNLQCLYLSNNAITHLYDGALTLTVDSVIARELGQPRRLSSLAGLTALKTLWLQDNELSSLPESIGGLTALKWLDIGNNNLSRIPDFFWGRRDLKKLGLNTNKKLKLPSFEELRALACLGINRIF